VRQVAADYQAVLRALGDEMTGSWLGLDLSMAQLKALFVIDRDPHATITVVSERLGVGASAASLTIDRLVRAGLAARSEDELDRRRVHVRPTAEGAALVARLRHGSESLLQTWLGELSPTELAGLASGLAALLRVAERRRHARPRRGR
jgi:DNA-binding MarR family transcriptional regulator